MASMEASLSDLFGNEPIESESKPKESLTVSTADSRQKSDKKKKSKRGGKKKEKGNDKETLGSSLSNMALRSPTRAISDDAITTGTQDSLQLKSPTAKDKPKKRGGKKKKIPELETSLTEMLTDEDDEPNIYIESLTIQKRDKSKTKTKQSGKKKKDLGSVLSRLDAPKDFGRDEDDNDTFCGLGTVGDNEAPHLKAKIVKSPSQAKTKAVRGNTMMMPKDDSDSEEEDLFESFDSNPFRVPY